MCRYLESRYIHYSRHYFYVKRIPETENDVIDLWNNIKEVKTSDVLNRKLKHLSIKLSILNY